MTYVASLRGRLDGLYHAVDAVKRAHQAGGSDLERKMAVDRLEMTMAMERTLRELQSRAVTVDEEE